MFLAGLCLLIFSLSAIISQFAMLYMLGRLSMDNIIFMMPSYVIFVIIGIVGLILMVVGLCMKRKINRTTVRIPYTNLEEVQTKVPELLMNKGYKSITERGENVWKCGVGLLTAIKYIKIEYAENNTLLVSGWIRAVGGNEQDLSGKFVCVVPKKQVRKVITEIQSFVS